MRMLTRRQFLKRGSVTVAGVLTLPAIVHAQNRGEKLGVAVVGFRGRGMSHIQAFLRDPRTVIRYLVEVDEKSPPQPQNGIRKAARCTCEGCQGHS